MATIGYAVIIRGGINVGVQDQFGDPDPSVDSILKTSFQTAIAQLERIVSSQTKRTGRKGAYFP